MSRERTQFKPGESGNPHGGRLHNQDIRRLKKLSHEHIAELATLITTKNYKEIKAITEDEETSALKLWMARIVMRAIKDGDMHTLNAFLPWSAGHLPNKVETKHMHLIEQASRIGSLTKEQAVIEMKQTLLLLEEQKDKPE